MTRSPDDFDALVAAHSAALLRLAVMLTGNRADAEDLLQTALLRAYRQGERVPAMAAPAAYLRRILVNEHLRNARRTAARPRVVALDEHDPPAVERRSPDDHDAVWRLLATLPPRQRAVLVLRYYEALPDAVIADVLGIAPGTVRSTMHRGLEAIRVHVADNPQEAIP